MLTIGKKGSVLTIGGKGLGWLLGCVGVIAWEGDCRSHCRGLACGRKTWVEVLLTLPTECMCVNGPSSRIIIQYNLYQIVDICGKHMQNQRPVHCDFAHV